MNRLSSILFTLSLALFGFPVASATGVAAEGGSVSGHVWKQLVTEADQMGLPTKFLKAVPPEFVTFEFDDLQAFAAEYHLGEHRMVLNRTLSFNAAGGRLRPLAQLTHTQLETLYHELFHAYVDYLSTVQGDAPSPLLSFARAQQRCRYSAVLITPVVQRKSETEERFLTETESWEALNEAWAVFIGWAVWNQLELQHRTGRSMLHERGSAQQWIQRFKAALEKGEFRGYYVPEDPEERRVTQKRFLAKPSQLTLGEATVLMEQVFGFSNDFTKQMDASVGQPGRLTCSPAREKAN